jgi:NADPH:quinone reductase-like Zn-dependent oxidoreductase
MKAAIVTASGLSPVYGDFPAPELKGDAQLVSVSAAALSQLVKSRASGAHYSSDGLFPFVAGVDGVGRLASGARVYFVMPAAPYGAMAETVAISPLQCVPVPDALDDVTAAALGNPGMSSWAALTERAKFVAGETVLVNGATGTSGQLAVQIAKRLGAGRVIATGRNPAVLKALAALGADVTISLTGDKAALETRFRQEFAAGVDIVLDYLWGPSSESILIAAATSGANGKPIRFVQIGSIGGADISLPGALLRSSSIVMMGSGIGSVSFDGLLRAIGGVMQAAAEGPFTFATRAVPLSDVAAAWTAPDHGARIVFTMGG